MRRLESVVAAHGLVETKPVEKPRSTHLSSTESSEKERFFANLFYWRLKGADVGGLRIIFFSMNFAFLCRVIDLFLPLCVGLCRLSWIPIDGK